jgi:site-specific DNA-cytosine methylase
VIEFCGGISAGLEAILANKIVVRRYLYADTDGCAQAAARHRVQNLSMSYPYQLAPEAFSGMFSIPQDVRELNGDILSKLQLPPHLPVLLVVGWPCQDLSPAGAGKGLEGNRSGLVSQVLQALNDLQQQHPQPVAYVLENAAAQHNFKHPQVAIQSINALTAALGDPVCLDAAQFNSRAHRLRNYWTNLASPNAVQHAASF